MNRQFILHERRHFDNMVAAVGANWEAMSAAGQPLGVTVAVYRRTRSSEQNALLWVWMTKAAAQAWVGGRQFDPETWHEHCKRQYLPERNAKGDDKWRILPSGDRLLAMSTTRLNTREMSEYMEAVAAFLSGELGVDLDA